MTDSNRTRDRVPAAGQQHGSSTGAGGSVGTAKGKPRHPRPETPESKVEHQADQPGVTTNER
jgi:hypothetical protein